MPRPKLYDDNAQRQAAYRRRKGSPRATTLTLANLASRLHSVIEEEVLYGEFPLPEDILAPSTEQTLGNLIAFLNTVYEQVENPNGRNIRPPRQERLKIKKRWEEDWHKKHERVPADGTGATTTTDEQPIR